MLGLGRVPFRINVEQAQRLQMTHICDPISDLVHGSLWTWAEDKAAPGNGTHLRGAFIPVGRGWGPWQPGLDRQTWSQIPAPPCPGVMIWSYDISVSGLESTWVCIVHLVGGQGHQGGSGEGHRAAPVRPSARRSSGRRTRSLLGAAYAHLWTAPKSGARVPKQQHSMARPHTWWQHAHSLAR